MYFTVIDTLSKWLHVSHKLRSVLHKNNMQNKKDKDEKHPLKKTTQGK